MEPNSSDPTPNPVAPKVVAGLSKISIALKSQSWQEAGPRGLTPTQAQILNLLRERGSAAGRLLDLVEALAVTPATASDAVAALVRKGLVKKARSAGDGRALALSLTPKGRKEAERLASWPDFLIGAVDVLTPPEQEVFLRGLVKIMRTLQERGKIPVSRMCVTCRFFRASVHPGSAQPHHCAFVNAPIGDRDLRVECPEHIAADKDAADAAWSTFLGNSPAP